MAQLRVLLIREGDFFIHVQQLAELLWRDGLHVEVLNTCNDEPEPLYRDLVAKVRQQGITCHLVINRPGWFERTMVTFAFKLRVATRAAVVTPYKIRASRAALAASGSFDRVIAFDLPSLLLACRLFPDRPGKIIDYSLEISDESHADFQTSRAERSFRHFERAVLPKLGALMIQDRFRAAVLLRHVPRADRVRTILFPVAINGPARRRDARPQRGGEARILFFGGLWSERFLKELEMISARLDPGLVLVVRGGRGTIRPRPSPGSRLDLSTAPIPFDEVNDVIGSADIGVALYPNDEANSRCSAFASEKVARYLQCGLPFIAFASEDYAFLRDETGCCELVAAYAEVPDAINRILGDYGRYQQAATAAFERFYSRDRTGPALIRELAGLPS